MCLSSLLRAAVAAADIRQYISVCADLAFANATTVAALQIGICADAAAAFELRTWSTSVSNSRGRRLLQGSASTGHRSVSNRDPDLALDATLVRSTDLEAADPSGEILAIGGITTHRKLQQMSLSVSIKPISYTSSTTLVTSSISTFTSTCMTGSPYLLL